MKAGFVQFAPELCNPEKNLTKLAQLLDSVEQADFLVLPELCNSGYNFKSKQKAFEYAEDPLKSNFVDLLSQQCAKKNMYIAAGFNEKADDKIYNSAVLVGPDGYIGKYRKIHLFLNEKDIFSPGTGELPVFDTKIGKLAMLVCFDWVFPEIWRILALKGAEIVAHCSNLVLPGFAQRSVPVHALINHYYVITANRIGSEDELTFTGMSTIAAPDGSVLYQSEEDVTEIKLVDCDLEKSRNKMITPKNHLINDRRPELYKDLLS